MQQACACDVSVGQGPLPAVKKPHDTLNHRHISIERVLLEGGATLLPRQQPAIQVDGGPPRRFLMVHRVQEICARRQSYSCECDFVAYGALNTLGSALHSFAGPALHFDCTRVLVQVTQMWCCEHLLECKASTIPGPTLNPCTMRPRFLHSTNQPQHSCMLSLKSASSFCLVSHATSSYKNHHTD